MTHRLHGSAAMLTLGALLAPTAAGALPPSQTSLLNSFDPDTRAAISAELATCPSCQLERLDDGTPNILMPPDAEPLATPDAAPRASTAAPPASNACVPGDATVDRSAEHLRRLGNTWFGVYYRAASNVSAGPARTERAYHADIANAVGGAVFGHDVDVARVEASADARSGGARGVNGRVYVRSRYGSLIQIASRSASTSGRVTLPTMGATREFWSGEHAFPLGPLLVKVQGALTGSVSYAVSANTGASNASVTGTPLANLVATAYVGLDGGIVGFGAEGTLTLAQGSLPNYAGVARRTDGSHTFDLTSDANVVFLRGSLDAKLRLGFWRLSKTWSHNLVRWGGFEFNTSLYSAHGIVPICSTTTGTTTGTLLR